jgi:flagellin-like protein
MNVWGTNERSWRKARKRAVSPIIATILLVAITVVLAAVLYVLISGLTHGPGNTPIGSAFNAGQPIGSICAAASTFLAKGCLTGDYTYALTIESSTISFGSALLQVKTAAGSIDGTTGGLGFSVVNTAGAVVAQFGVAGGTMSMTAGWTYFLGTTAATPMTNLYGIIIDMGTAPNPASTGLTFDALGTGSYSGTTAPLALP